MVTQWEDSPGHLKDVKVMVIAIYPYPTHSSGFLGFVLHSGKERVLHLAQDRVNPAIKNKY